MKTTIILITISLATIWNDLQIKSVPECLMGPHIHVKYDHHHHREKNQKTIFSKLIIYRAVLPLEIKNYRTIVSFNKIQNCLASKKSFNGLSPFEVLSVHLQLSDLCLCLPVRGSISTV